MKELSIFVDESGDFGEYDYRSPFYIIAMVFHEQSIDISNDLQILERELSNVGLAEHCVHAGPVIRAEHEYKEYGIEERQHILKRLMTFVRKLDLKIKTVYIEKKNLEDSVEYFGKLSKQLSNFIRAHLDYFLSFESIKIYYDNGQVEVSRLLSSVFNALLDNVSFRKVVPSKYRLFQVADLVCTLKLTELKMLNHSLSKSELLFFSDERTLKKNYLKVIESKKFP
jgi:DNA gyrase/topoisomerase IV subunit A